MKSASLV